MEPVITRHRSPDGSPDGAPDSAPDGGGAVYVHGYTDREERRLGEQADALADLLHGGTRYPAGARVLEVGCGVGAQTVHLLEGSPGVDLTCVDVSAESLARARARVAAARPGARVTWVRADLHDLPFGDAEFDHLFVCFVLEHLADPVAALAGLRRVLRPGGTLTVIEGDHASAFFHPDSEPARAVVGHLIALQAAAGGDALIGRRLHPLLEDAGYLRVAVGPRTVYVDGSRPELVQGFIHDTFTAMVGSVRAEALASGRTTPQEWERGVEGLRRTAAPGGTFHYTFFKATAVNPPA
ncbi:methyltransferase domain-containing protein [Actinomadura sp. WMMB 499]|uniref:class I SAM-dependent methyltransferase n=1 Tax=Actinomadura sp. WMMB 499 TaxID=1219491 RepID=UPI001247B285|nr:methyltransferase domain-containing protein [Actinomadura sp. WMMB 499]QFG26731.1 methyltransferase domain-containing protein [Actinomadura sp. WMMB 499]